MEASGSAEALNIIVTRTALRTNNTIERTAVINDTQSIRIEPVPRNTSSTLPRRRIEIGTILRHTVIISQSILRLTFLALVSQVIKRYTIEHVTKVSKRVEVVPGDTLGTWVVLVRESAELELAGSIGGQLKSSLALETCADVGGAVGCAVFRNA